MTLQLGGSSGINQSTNLMLQSNGADQVKIDASGNMTLLNGQLNTPHGILMSTPFSYRNRIINGDMRVQQRSSSVVSTGVSGYGGPDRFYVTNTGTGGQFTQSAATMVINGVGYASCRQTVNTPVSTLASSNYWFGIRQVIEGYNAYDLCGGVATVSFWFNSNLAGIFSVSMRDGSPTKSYVTTFSYPTANTPQYVTLLIPTIPLGIISNTNGYGIDVTIGFLNTGTYQTATLGSWQSGNYVSASTATNWGATTGNFIEITQLQLEAGAIATPFEFLRYQDQLLQCQRYYQSWGQTGNVFMGSGAVIATTLAYISICTACAFRAAPTFSYASGSPQLYTGTANVNATGFGTVYWGANSPNVGLGVTSSGLTVGNGIALYTNATTVYATAEL